MTVVRGKEREMNGRTKGKRERGKRHLGGKGEGGREGENEGGI